MKKFFLIAASVLVAMSAAAQTKSAYVNLNELIQLMPEMDAARTTMTAAQKEVQETGQAMMQEFQTKYTQYQQTAANSSQSVREVKEKELTEMQTRIQEFEQSAQQELQQKYQQLLAPINEKAVKTVSDIAKAAGYAFVFDASQYIYVDPAQAVDITAQARKALNIPEGRTLETLAAELQAQQQALADAAAPATQK